MLTRIIRVLGMALLCGALLVTAGGRAAGADEFPTRPVEIIISYAPGGTLDLAVRILHKELSRAMGAPVILTNKSGGGSAVGIEYVARAKPNGYTILATSVSYNILRILNPDVHFKPADFIPLCKYTESPNVIVVRKDSPYKSFGDIIAAAKKNPGKVSGATVGAGTATQFTLDMIKLKAGVNIASLPYRSGGEVNISVLGGQVDFASTGFSPTMGLLKSGDLVALASTTGKGKIKGFPNVPTLEELGYPEVSLPIPWMGFFLPAGTPKPLVNKLTAIFAKAMKNQAVEKNLENAGQFVAYQDGATFAKFLGEEYRVLEDVARKTALIK